MDIEKLVTWPVFFERNRVYRIYLGGKPYQEIFRDGYDDGADNMFPEEWVASKVKAINPKYFGKRDGVSVVKGTDIFFDDLLRDYSEELLGGRKYDCLVKFLDSAIRLPFQVHPTKDFSRKYFHSEYGKTEAWLVVATRPGAKLYFGFKDKITKEELAALEERSETEKDIMGGLLQGVDVKPSVSKGRRSSRGRGMKSPSAAATTSIYPMRQRASSRYRHRRRRCLSNVCQANKHERAEILKEAYRHGAVLCAALHPA